MGVKIYIDGTVHDTETAVVPVFDRGFLYGDSVYEVMRTSGGHPVDLVPHLDRLVRSAGSLALAVPPRGDVEAALGDTLAEAGNDESYIRLMVTRGGGRMGLDPAFADSPRMIIIVRPLELPPAHMYDAGIKLKLVGVERTARRAVDPAVKSGNYLNNILALQEARKSGADEAIMCNAAGRVAEGSSSNVFVVKDRRLATPPLAVGLLAGITRQRVMTLARADGLEIAEQELMPAHMHAADEVFITSSVRGVLPATELDGEAVGDGRPGPVTRRVMELYRSHLASEARQ